MNFKVATGATFARVLIASPSSITDFIRSGFGVEPLTASSIQLLRRSDAGRAKRCRRARRSGRFGTSVLDAVCEYATPPVIAGQGSNLDPRALLAVGGTKVKSQPKDDE